MASLYIHIPFCKQACHYCDFHFSTSMKHKSALVDALIKEMQLRKDEVNEPLETIYFGGGTPSLLSQEELQNLLQAAQDIFKLSENPEITLEANPDDLTTDVLAGMANAGVNRLSIGVQSFFDADLKLMNRAHCATEAYEALRLAKQYFTNISIDLIYGIPNASDEQWNANLEKALSLAIPHISSYALTVEPQTALAHLIKKGKIKPVDEAQAKRQFNRLVSCLTDAGYEHYEFSNFGKPGFYSKNNTAYWTGKPYLGIGPAAHSFNGESRSWNVANNIAYIKAIKAGELPSTHEKLSLQDRYNEYVMTGLRTQRGISEAEIQNHFGDDYLRHFQQESLKLFRIGQLQQKEDRIVIHASSKFLSDGIAADLFRVD